MQKIPITDISAEEDYFSICNDEKVAGKILNIEQEDSTSFSQSQ